VDGGSKARRAFSRRRGVSSPFLETRILRASLCLAGHRAIARSPPLTIAHRHRVGVEFRTHEIGRKFVPPTVNPRACFVSVRGRARLAAYRRFVAAMRCSFTARRPSLTVTKPSLTARRPSLAAYRCLLAAGEGSLTWIRHAPRADARRPVPRKRRIMRNRGVLTRREGLLDMRKGFIARGPCPSAAGACLIHVRECLIHVSMPDPP
jgi:hypothetical protein